MTDFEVFKFPDKLLPRKLHHIKDSFSQIMVNHKKAAIQDINGGARRGYKSGIRISGICFS